MAAGDEALLSGVFHHAPTGMALISPDGRWLRVNAALCEMSGYREDDLVGQPLQAITHPEDVDLDLPEIRRMIAGETRRCQVDTRYRHRNGRVLWTRSSVSVLRDETGAPQHFICQVEDITQRKESEAELRLAREYYEAELERLAAHDSLTGLANHRVFHERLDAETARAIRHGRPLSIAILNLDHFRRINDRHGRLVGDQVLRDTAEQLAGLARKEELIARVGGEEFAWILPDAYAGGAFAAAERARHAIRSSQIAPSGRLTLSAGVCDLTQTRDVSELYRMADEALYRAKQAGRDRTARYSRQSARLEH